MYAIFQNGGKQYKVRENQIIKLEKLNKKIGDKIIFKNILMISKYNDNVIIGNPFLYTSNIIAKIISHGKNDKITIIKFNRRKHFRKKQGHRQHFTELKIININI